jgi:DNA helicase-2/ATP-dependent DNA helicase PcrA
MAFAARFPGRCACGASFQRGAMIDYRGGAVTGCPACGGGGARGAGRGGATGGGEPLPGGFAAPEARRAAKAPRRVIPTPSAEEARAALAALNARLDPDQTRFAAWRPGDGNLRALAGAGSGKTTASVALVGNLLASGVDPAGVIATTFTRKAAGELSERLARVVAPGAMSILRVGTFHSLAGRIVARARPGLFAEGRNMDGDRRVDGIPSSSLLWEKILGWAGPEGLPGTAEEGLGLDEPDVRAYSLAIDVVRSRPLLTASEVEVAVRAAEVDTGLAHLSRAWGMYRRVKAATGAWDFADVIAALYAGLADGSITDGARVVIVDEAQDNSAIFLEIATLLARNGRGEVILVGDARQSIYGWRGAFPAMFRDADTRIGAATVALPSNYRSGSAIVALGNTVAAGRSWAVGEPSRAARDGEGTITVQGYGDVSEEADAVAADIAAAAAGGSSLDSIAILARTNAQAAAFEAALVKARIPCVVVGGKPFFTRREVADFLAYATLHVRDDVDAFARIVNRPKRMLGKVFVAQVKGAPGATLADRVARAADDCRASGQRAAARSLAALLTRLRSASWAEVAAEVGALLTPPATARRAGAADEDRGGLLAAAVTLAGTFADAGAFLAFAARCAGEVEQAGADDGLPPGRVVISTIHKAKGLEWTTVYLSATAGTFPHARCEGDTDRMEEEERLFYVAVTRAKDALHLTYSEEGLRGGGGPSRFLAHVTPNATRPTPPLGGGERVPAPLLTESEAPAAPVVPAEAPTPAARPLAGATDAERREAAQGAVRAAVEADRDGEPYQISAPSLFAPEAWTATERAAQAGTDAEPHATPGEGGRYVTVEAADFAALLGGLGFTAREECGQIVLATDAGLTKGTATVKVYTSIPTDGAVAREVGEDSIKVAALWHHKGDTEARPLHRRLPYAARTRGWRLAVLKRIAEVSGVLADGLAHPCRRCGAPTVERKRRDGSGTFRGCTRFSECNPTRATAR